MDSINNLASILIVFFVLMMDNTPAHGLKVKTMGSQPTNFNITINSCFFFDRNSTRKNVFLFNQCNSWWYDRELHKLVLSWSSCFSWILIVYL